MSWKIFFSVHLTLALRSARAVFKPGIIISCLAQWQPHAHTPTHTHPHTQRVGLTQTVAKTG